MKKSLATRTLLPLLACCWLPLTLPAKDLATIFADAEAGNRQAQFALGAMYETGRGVPRDDALCAKWWRASAEQGLADAQKNMGSLYFSGRGVPLDVEEAMRWFLLAAEQDHPHAQQYVALGYAEGMGLPKDPGRAAWWREQATRHDPANAAVVFLAAYENQGEGVTTDDEIFALFERQAQAGNPRAQFYIGVAYSSGMGVRKDSQQAHYWIKKAAELGVKSAQGNLGIMYMLGDGIPRDPVAAQKWFVIAAGQGSDVGLYLRERNAEVLDAAELAWAEAAAREWLAGSRASGSDGS
jgi:uncharacterized protein